MEVLETTKNRNATKVKAKKRKLPEEESSNVSKISKSPRNKKEKSSEAPNKDVIDTSEYLVGSISDLITGKHTPNKPKIVKQVLPKKVREVQENIETNSLQVEDETVKPTKTQKLTPNSSKKKPNRKAHDEADEHKLVVIDHSQLIPTFDASQEDKVQQKKSKLTNKQIKEREDGMKLLTEKQIIAQKDDNSRSIFVGNVATTTKKSHLMKLFVKFGPIKSVRLRGIAPSAPGITKRLAAIKKLFHDKCSTVHAYVVFEKREDAIKAVELNGFNYRDHYLRVELLDNEAKHESNKAIFLGNLSFEAEDEDLWKAFEPCGPITSVRVVRNSASGIGLGIGYVNFEFADSVELALQMYDVKIKGKIVRIKRYQLPKNKNNVQYGSGRPKFRDGKPRSRKDERLSEGAQQSGAIKKNVFRGKKALKKQKKPKLNGEVAKKMKLSSKIAPKTNNSTVF